MFYSDKKKLVSTFCSPVTNLCEAKFTCDNIIDLAEEISRQTSMQAVTWVLLVAFSHFIIKIRKPWRVQESYVQQRIARIQRRVWEG